MLQAAEVSIAFGGKGEADPARPHPGLHGVTLHVEPGSLVGVLGPNGSGKTTLIRALSGMLTPQSGRVMLDGMDISRMSRPAIARRMAIVPQETHLAFDYSVLEIVLMGRYPHLRPFELEGPDDLAKAREALAATGTSSLERRPYATLSGGEKQRVIIASALAQAAAIMLLDEPTASLDPGYQIEIAALLRRLNAERRITMIVATHDLNFAASICRQLVLLRSGRVLASGPTSAVLTAARVAELYGVEADVQHHERAGHITVVPIRRTGSRDQAEGVGRKA